MLDEIEEIEDEDEAEPNAPDSYPSTLQSPPNLMESADCCQDTEIPRRKTSFEDNLQ